MALSAPALPLLDAVADLGSASTSQLRDAAIMDHYLADTPPLIEVMKLMTRLKDQAESALDHGDVKMAFLRTQQAVNTFQFILSSPTYGLQNHGTAPDATVGTVADRKLPNNASEARGINQKGQAQPTPESWDVPGKRSLDHPSSPIKSISTQFRKSQSIPTQSSNSSYLAFLEGISSNNISPSSPTNRDHNVALRQTHPSASTPSTYHTSADLSVVPVPFHTADSTVPNAPGVVLSPSKPPSSSQKLTTSDYIEGTNFGGNDNTASQQGGTDSADPSPGVSSDPFKTADEINTAESSPFIWVSQSGNGEGHSSSSSILSGQMKGKGKEVNKTQTSGGSSDPFAWAAKPLEVETEQSEYEEQGGDDESLYERYYTVENHQLLDESEPHDRPPDDQSIGKGKGKAVDRGEYALGVEAFSSGVPLESPSIDEYKRVITLEDYGDAEGILLESYRKVITSDDYLQGSDEENYPPWAAEPPHQKQSSANFSERECIICTNDLPTLSFPAKPPTPRCQHISNICSQCLGRYIEAEVTAKGASPEAIHCPIIDCRSNLDYDDVKRLAEPVCFERYETLVLRQALGRDDNFVWCKNPACPHGQIHMEADAGPIVICHVCRSRSCFRHDVLWHEGITCDQYDREASEDEAENGAADDDLIEIPSWNSYDPRPGWLHTPPAMGSQHVSHLRKAPQRAIHPGDYRDAGPSRFSSNTLPPYAPLHLPQPDSLAHSITPVEPALASPVSPFPTSPTLPKASSSSNPLRWLIKKSPKPKDSSPSVAGREVEDRSIADRQRQAEKALRKARDLEARQATQQRAREAKDRAEQELREQRKRQRREEAATDGWIQKITKECPHCTQPIEKNGGCDNMMCTRCKKGFKWSSAHGTRGGRV